MRRHVPSGSTFRGTLALAATDFVWNAASAQPAAAFAAPFVRGSSVRSGATGGPRGHNGDMPPKEDPSGERRADACGPAHGVHDKICK